MRSIEMLALAFDWLGARTPTGKDGTASWAKSHNDWSWKPAGGEGDPFWGMMHGKAVRRDYGNSAMTVAPSDSGKGEGSLIPNALALTKDSKVIISPKPDAACVLFRALKERGEDVRVLNYGRLHTEILGEPDRFNHFSVISDCIWKAGELSRIFDETSDFNNQLISDPPGGKGQNFFWDQASRELLTDIEISVAIVNGPDATLGDAAALLSDRQALEDHMRWLGGLDLNSNPHPGGPAPIEQAAEWVSLHDPQDVSEFIALVRGRARSLVKMMSGEGKTFDGVYEGAKLALAPFAFGPIARSMQNATTDFGAAKEGDRPVTFLVVLDPDNPTAANAYGGLTQHVMVSQLKRHPNKRRKVYVLADEITNAKVNKLPSLMILTRAWGIRWHIFAQDLQAIEETYGRNGLDTIWGECEIKQFLPGQTNDKTLARLSKAIGNASVMTEAISQNAERGAHVNLSESGRPLMTSDELYRSDKILLLVRREKPMLLDFVSYAEVEPWRRQVGIDPWYGKPYLKPVKLRL
jgi:type IV secretion system protein VirD4